MGMVKAGDAQPDIPADHVRVYVDVNVANVRAKVQEQIDEAKARIPQGDPDRTAKIAVERARLRKQYLDRILATAQGAFESQREAFNSQMSAENLNAVDSQIAAKQAEIVRLQEAKTVQIDGAAPVVGELS